jgi:hypothetical protein
MELPSRAAIQEARDSEQPARHVKRWKTGEEIPRNSWSVQLIWTSNDVDLAFFLAQQPALCEMLQEPLVEVGRPLAIASHGNVPNPFYWREQELELSALQTNTYSRISHALSASSLAPYPVRQWWLLAEVYGRLDPETTTHTGHYLLLHDRIVTYATCYQETLH